MSWYNISFLLLSWYNLDVGLYYRSFDKSAHFSKCLEKSCGCCHIAARGLCQQFCWRQDNFCQNPVNLFQLCNGVILCLERRLSLISDSSAFYSFPLDDWWHKCLSYQCYSRSFFFSAWDALRIILIILYQD